MEYFVWYPPEINTQSGIEAITHAGQVIGDPQRHGWIMWRQDSRQGVYLHWGIVEKWKVVSFRSSLALVQTDSPGEAAGERR